MQTFSSGIFSSLVKNSRRSDVQTDLWVSEGMARKYERASLDTCNQGFQISSGTIKSNPRGVVNLSIRLRDKFTDSCRSSYNYIISTFRLNKRQLNGNSIKCLLLSMYVVQSARHPVGLRHKPFLEGSSEHRPNSQSPVRSNLVSFRKYLKIELRPGKLKNIMLRG